MIGTAYKGTTTVSFKRKNRSRLRRRRGTHSRLPRSLSVGAMIALVVLASTFVLDQSFLRNAGETVKDSLVSAAPSAMETTITDPIGSASAEERQATVKAIPEGSRRGEVQRVVDGDTVYLQDGAKIRLHGIDAPERNQPYGKQSTAELRSMLGDSVYVDPRDVDRYGREVAVLYTPEGVNVNLELVCVGAAWWYERYAKQDRALRDCQASARGAGAGLWADDPIAPWEWRRR